MSSSSPPSAREHAHQLFTAGWTLSAIARHLDIKRATVASWKKRDQWILPTFPERLEDLLSQRLQLLIAKENKEGKDYKEIDLLGRQIVRFTRHDTTAKAKRSPNLLAIRFLMNKHKNSKMLF